ncbi:MAG: hypothetical protein OXI97_18425 [Acidimicrobiaceae bacterium]|nr:hypothetical protein [Acidimicrobiaceae bacterium]
MTAAVDWFEFGQTIAESHARNAIAEVTVIPVVVENLRAAKPVLEALVGIHEGCFLDASDPNVDPNSHENLYRPIPGTTDQVRREAIEAVLSKPDRQVNVIELANGLVDVRFHNEGPTELLSAGDQILHAVARAAAHEYLDEHSFAVIAYRAGPLDERSEKALWDLMGRQVHGSPRTTPQTLVVVVESNIDIGLHCEPDHGFRFAFVEGELLHRQGKRHLRRAATQIVGSSKSAPLVFFLGAGFSVSSGIQLGDQLRDDAILRLLDDPQFESLDSIDLGIEFHKWLSEMPGSQEWLSKDEKSLNSQDFASHLTLERVLVVEKRMHADLPTLQEFKEHHDSVVDQPGPSVLHFGQMLDNTEAKIIVVQLNFDCLVEHNTSKELRIFASDAEFAEASSHIADYCGGKDLRVPLLKLHGSIDSIETCVATQDQTSRGLGDAQYRALSALLGVSSEPLPWVYVGVSMRDRDMLQVLSGQQFARGLDERWVVPYIVPSVRTFGNAREPHWQATDLRTLDDRVITQTSDAFFEVLAEVGL